MKIKVTGLDHIFISVKDISISEKFYDNVMKLMGFKKDSNKINDELHINYYNKHFQYTLRPARADSSDYNSLNPGLHHLCFRVSDNIGVDEAYVQLKALGIEATKPRIYEEYGTDYYATSFSDPDGINLEIVNHMKFRQLMYDKWDELACFEDPLEQLGLF